MNNLQEKLSKHGFGTPEIILDGELHRFASEGDKNNNAWIVCHDNPDSVVCVAGDWKRNVKVTFCEPKSEHQIPKQKVNYEAERRIQKIAAQHKVFSRNMDALDHVYSLWKNAKPCTAHSYLISKQISGVGLRVDGNDNLLIPMVDIDGKHWNNQKINQEGAKFFSKGAKTKGCFHPIGDLINSETIVICEGSATGFTIHEVTGFTTVVCLSADNMLGVGEAIREEYPDAKLMYAADDDQYGSNNSGKEKATVAAQMTGGIVVLPQFACTKTKPTDFNDLFILEGSKVVNSQIVEAWNGL